MMQQSPDTQLTDNVHFNDTQDIMPCTLGVKLADQVLWSLAFWPQFISNNTRFTPKLATVRTVSYTNQAKEKISIRH